MITNELNPTEPNIGINALIDETNRPSQWKPMDVKPADRIANDIKGRAYRKEPNISAPKPL